MIVTAVVGLITFSTANLFQSDKMAYINDLTSMVAVGTAEEARSLGAQLGTGSFFDGTNLNLNVLKRNLDDGLDLLSDLGLVRIRNNRGEAVPLRSIAREAMRRKSGARGLRGILEDIMLDVMYDEPGIGLAGPQLGEPVRLIVVDTEWTEEGAEKNPLVMQIYADVCNRPMKISRSAQTCALGAALFGAVAGGAYRSAEAAQQKAEKAENGTLAARPVR